MKWIYFDVDGTLTMDGAHGNGAPRKETIAVVKELMKREDVFLIVWSARGMDYCVKFCRQHGIHALCLAKPHVCVDDNPNLHRKAYQHLPPERVGELL